MARIPGGTLYAKGIPVRRGEVLSDQGVDENLGLSNDEASSRLAKTGPNKLEEAEKTPLWKRFFEQMADPMVIMLIVAAVISALTGMVKGEADFADVAIIMFVVIVNSVLGVVQEAKAKKLLEAIAGDERRAVRFCATASSCTCRAPSSCPVT
ncbi:MAG: cation-transporting P-type ATPase [Collinsella sp.]